MYKRAVGPAVAAAGGAAAATGAGKLYDFLKGAVKIGATEGISVAKALSFLFSIGTGLAAGYGAAKLSSPVVLSGTSDKELTREALDTEIDVTQRQLASLELKKKRREQAANEEQKFDRFV